jgi:hypothetical protein
MTQMTATASDSSEFDDLDALLTEHALPPRTVKLGGRAFTVRRDLTGEEVLRYWWLAHNRKDIEALSIVVGENDAVYMDEMLKPLPMPKMQVVLGKIMRLAGLLPRDDINGSDKHPMAGDWPRGDNGSPVENTAFMMRAAMNRAEQHFAGEGGSNGEA